MDHIRIPKMGQGSTFHGTPLGKCIIIQYSQTVGPYDPSVTDTHFASHSATALLSADCSFPGASTGSSLFSREYGCLGQCRLACVNRLPQPGKTTTCISAPDRSSNSLALTKLGYLLGTVYLPSVFVILATCYFGDTRI